MFDHDVFSYVFQGILSYDTKFLPYWWQGMKLSPFIEISLLKCHDLMLPHICSHVQLKRQKTSSLLQPNIYFFFSKFSPPTRASLFLFIKPFTYRIRLPFTTFSYRFIDILIRKLFFWLLRNFIHCSKLLTKYKIHLNWNI